MKFKADGSKCENAFQVAVCFFCVSESEFALHFAYMINPLI